VLPLITAPRQISTITVTSPLALHDALPLYRIAVHRRNNVTDFQAGLVASASRRDFADLGAGRGEPVLLDLRADGDTDLGVRHLLAFREMLGHVFGQINRNSEAQTNGARFSAALTRRGADGRIDGDHLAVQIDQRATGVPGVDRGVGLNRRENR